MTGQRLGYVRVSSADQNPARQLETIGECSKVFTDAVSGKTRKRAGLAELLDYAREGDVIAVASMDRLGRDSRDLHALVDELAAKGCTVEFVQERMTISCDGSSPVDGLMLGVLAAFAEFERRRIRERQAEGIALAKAAGKYRHQPKIGPEELAYAAARVELGVPKAEIARELSVSRQTLYSALKRHPDGMRS